MLTSFSYGQSVFVVVDRLQVEASQELSASHIYEHFAGLYLPEVAVFMNFLDTEAENK
jgi:hypothetical protein